MAEPACRLQPHGCACESLRPTDELVSRLHFDAAEGRIWLGEQRMLLLHSSTMGVLRQELIEGLGLDRARGLITRIGYHCGAHDAELARHLHPQGASADAVCIGPQLHMLEGVARVEKVRLEVDQEAGHFLGEFNWHGCAEAEAHVQAYGIGSDTVCWQQTGYASGFVSRFMGRPVVFREIQCRAQGAPHCVIVGRPAEAWQDAEADLARLRADELSLGVAARAGRSPLDDQAVVGVSAAFNAVCHMVRRAARTQATVLFLGESGVGKEVLAQALHRIGPRAAGPFVAINCAAIPDELIESELFGVDKGGYTGAMATRPTPNSSASTRSGGMAAQFTAMKGPASRGLTPCSAREAFLADAALAAEQQGRVGRRDLAHQMRDRVEAGRGADEARTASCRCRWAGARATRWSAATTRCASTAAAPAPTTRTATAASRPRPGCAASRCSSAGASCGSGWATRRPIRRSCRTSARSTTDRPAASATPACR